MKNNRFLVNDRTIFRLTLLILLGMGLAGLVFVLRPQLAGVRNFAGLMAGLALLSLLFTLLLWGRVRRTLRVMTDLAAQVTRPGRGFTRSGDTFRDVSRVVSFLAEDLAESYRRIDANTSELRGRHDELAMANQEIEASYEQLQAALEQLNEAESKYRSLVHNIPDMVCIIEQAGRIAFVNDVTENVVGYSPEEMIHTSIYDYVENGQLEFSVEDIMDALAVRPKLVVELIFACKDGQRIITEASFTDHNQVGMSRGVQVIFRDVTEERRMQDEVMRSVKELETLNTLTSEMTKSLDVDRVASIIARDLSDVLGYEGALFAVYEPTALRFRPKSFAGPLFETTLQIQSFGRFCVQNSHITRAMELEGLVTGSFVPEEWVISDTALRKMDNNHNREFALIPMRNQNRTVGFLLVVSSARIGHGDRHLLNSIANHASVVTDNAMLYANARKYFIRTIDALVAAIEAKDKYTEGHSQRVADYAAGIAGLMGMEFERVEDVKIAGILHDIGKIGVSDAILLKSERLTDDEYEVIKQHPLISNKILYPVGFSNNTIKAIALHHERFDGRGYPFGLKADEIPMEAHILSVADAFDAMTSSRPYRRSMTRDAAVTEILNCRGQQFHPQVVDAFLVMLEDEKKKRLSEVDKEACPI